MDDGQQAPTLSEEELLFMARLSSQFGDLDLKSLLVEENPDGAEDGSAAVASEESSLDEPSPEELAAWQAQQFASGKAAAEAKQQEEMDPVQKRRLQLRKDTADLLLQTKKSSSSSESLSADGDGWEQIAACPNLQGQSSVFFPSTVSGDGMGGGDGDYDDNDADSSSVVVLGSHPLLQELANLGDAEILGTAWHRLYSSVEGDGLSFHNLMYGILGYDGPTVILLKCLPSKSRSLQQSGGSTTTTKTPLVPATIGFFTTTTWQESSDYFGSNTDDCFLFSLNYDTNQAKILRPRSHGKKGGGGGTTAMNKHRHEYMYCHPSTLSSRRGGGKTKGATDGAVHGIGIGGKPSQPRLHLTETLEECRALTYDLLFEEGDLLASTASSSDGNPFQDSLYYFDVDCLEAWGVGGNAWIQDALAARNKARGIAQASLKKRQIIDKSQVLDDFRNGLLSTTTKTVGSGAYFTHFAHTAEGRCDM
jgi:hypothetical protein